MEELYYWGSKTGYTWKQLLYKITKFIDGSYSYYNWRDEYNRKLSVDNFFKDYSHNDNDGIWKKERRKGEYSHYALYSVILTRKIEVKYYYKPDYTVNVFYPKRNRIVDSYGRIIPSSLVRRALSEYILNENDNPNQRKYWYRYYLGGSKYRRRWHTSRFKGDHGFLGNECRQNMIFRTEEDDIFDEFGVYVKYNKSRYSEVKSLYTDWDSRDIYGAIKRSWKRSKKRKQWM